MFLSRNNLSCNYFLFVLVVAQTCYLMTKLVNLKIEISLLMFFKFFLLNSWVLQRQSAQKILGLKGNVFQSTKHRLALVIIIYVLSQMELEKHLQSWHQTPCFVDQDPEPAQAGDMPTQWMAKLGAGAHHLIPFLLPGYFLSPTLSFILRIKAGEFSWYCMKCVEWDVWNRKRMCSISVVGVYLQLWAM